MSTRPDWTEWILQKNNDATAEDLKKSNSVEIESLEKGAAAKIEPGTFNIDHVRAVSDMKDHGAAKEYAHKVLSESSANPKNKTNIARMINSSKSSAHLAQGMANHVLAHPSEGLKVVKGDSTEC